MKLENSKEALHKAQEATTSKKKIKGIKWNRNVEMTSVKLRRSRVRVRRSHEVD